MNMYSLFLWCVSHSPYTQWKPLSIPRYTHTHTHKSQGYSLTHRHANTDTHMHPSGHTQL